MRVAFVVNVNQSTFVRTGGLTWGVVAVGKMAK